MIGTEDIDHPHNGPAPLWAKVACAASIALVVLLLLVMP